MIILDAIKQPSKALWVPMRPNGSAVLTFPEPPAKYTAAGILLESYQDSLAQLTFEGETLTSEDNAYARALSTQPSREIAVYYTEHQVSEPLFNTRPAVPGLPTRYGLSVDYYPVFYGVVEMQEVRPITSCSRSVWQVKFTETRKLSFAKPQIWDGASSALDGDTFTYLASDTEITRPNTLDYSVPANLDRIWYRATTSTNGFVFRDTGVVYR